MGGWTVASPHRPAQTTTPSLPLATKKNVHMHEYFVINKYERMSESVRVEMNPQYTNKGTR